MNNKRNRTNKQKGNGEGTIYYSEVYNRYVAQYVDSFGKRRTLKQRKNEKVGDFKKRFTNEKSKVYNKIDIAKSQISLYDILKDYIENKYKTGNISIRTYNRNIETLKLLEKFCKNYIYIPIQKVTIQNIKNSLPLFTELEYAHKKSQNKVTKKYSQNVIDKAFAMLKKGFKIAVADRIINYNLMENENIVKPKSKKITKEINALTVEEESKLINILNSNEHKYKYIILLCLYTGLRIGEALAITRDNIDITNKTLTINKTLTLDKNNHVILGETTKTQAGTRTIFLNNYAIDVLKNVCKSKIINIHNLIFYDYKNNTFVTPNEINLYLKRLNAKYNFCENIHTHMLRHTYATRCIEAGMSAKVLQKNLGHSKIEITLNTYTSVFENFNKDENEKYEIYMQEISKKGMQ